MTSSAVLSVRNLTTSFKGDTGWKTVVKDVSFEVGANETVAVVGESGSGKSVTAMSIMRLTPPGSSRIEGSVLFNGQDLTTLSLQQMRKIRGNDIAVIFQEPMTSLNPVLTIGLQISEAIMLHRGISQSAAKAEAIRLLEKVRIPAAASRFNEYPHRFSGGMRQRVMIAMALACNPRLLIADEPTTALDVTIQAQILELIRDLQKEDGMSVLFITHDMGVVAEIADRTVVMYNGSMVETGPTEAIFYAATQPYTRALLASVPRLGAMVGADRPMHFPIVDRISGHVTVPKMMPDTVQADASPLLDVKGLTTRFDIRSGLLSRVTGRVHAVENVSFSLQAGETLALVGESGCGKSTTGRSVMRLIEPVAGTISLEGRDITGLDRKRLMQQRKRMQMIFQDPFAALNPRMSVGRAIMEPLMMNGLASASKAQDKAMQLLSEVGLNPDMAGRFPHEFSGGQRQRICIARALALEPRVIIADESVSALDVSVKAQVVNLMLELQERLNLSYLFISHDMAVVERVSHRVAVMYLGEIVEIGAREAIFGNPQHPYTKRLLAAVPIADPSRRLHKRPLAATEVRSAVRSPDYQPPARQYRTVSPDHSVMVWGAEWDVVQPVAA